MLIKFNVKKIMFTFITAHLGVELGYFLWSYINNIDTFYINRVSNFFIIFFVAFTCAYSGIEKTNEESKKSNRALTLSAKLKLSQIKAQLCIAS